jgi:hypothetical protein
MPTCPQAPLLLSPEVPEIAREGGSHEEVAEVLFIPWKPWAFRDWAGRAWKPEEGAAA